MSEFTSSTSRWARVTALLAVLALAVFVAGCGSSDDDSGDTASDGDTASITGNFNQDAADLLPQEIADSGKLTVAMDASYAPNEFFDEDGKTIIGMNADIADALGTTLGLETEKKNTTFDAIIPGLEADKFNLGISSFTDNKEREKVVDFVTYLTAGTGFYTTAENGVDVESLEDLCGKKVAVQKGTVQQEDVEAQNEKCSEKIDIAVFTQQTDVDLALRSGKAEVALADSPVALYAVQQSDGALKSTGTTYDTAPYGIAIPKDSGLAEAVLAAVKVMIADGTYEAILAKWGQESGAIKTPVINGAES